MPILFSQAMRIGRGLPRAALRPIARRAFARTGDDVLFDPFDYFEYGEIEIGDHVFIGPGAWFAGRKIKIGSYVMFGPRVMMQAGSHDISVVEGTMHGAPERPRELVRGIVIEDNVWIAAGVTLIDGAHVMAGTVVGAGSLVTGEIPPNSIAVGTPARVIRERLDTAALERHRRFLSELMKTRSLRYGGRGH